MKPPISLTLLFFIFCTILNGSIAQEEPAAGATLTCMETEEGVSCNNSVSYRDIEEHDTGSRALLDIVVVFALVCVAGMMSGLTLGLLSLDPMNLEIIMKAGDPKDSERARKLMPLIKRHHLLLVTLLLANAAAMETLPIFLDRLVPTVFAIVISVTLVLLFGEIIPQAACSRYGLAIGANLAYLVWGIIGLFFPVAYPLSKLLDLILGTHQGTFLRRRELKELLNLHGAPEESTGQAILTMDETTIMKGALDLKDKIALNVMTPIDKVFMLEVDMPLDAATLRTISDSGRSRIPVYRDSRDYIIGVLLVKSLLTSAGADMTVNDLPIRRLPTVSGNTQLYDLLNQFQIGKSHMAVVVSPTDSFSVLGVVTLEDVIEELIQEEIYDETDLLVEGKDNKNKNQLHIETTPYPYQDDDYNTSNKSSRAPSRAQSRYNSDVEGSHTPPRLAPSPPALDYGDDDDDDDDDDDGVIEMGEIRRSVQDPRDKRRKRKNNATKSNNLLLQINANRNPTSIYANSNLNIFDDNDPGSDGSAVLTTNWLDDDDSTNTPRHEPMMVLLKWERYAVLFKIPGTKGGREKTMQPNQTIFFFRSTLIEIQQVYMPIVI
eukprot:TRINITY_DN2423_c0_g2_i1.p1 TRINITY_DN2423_c0_g2~~TRINITY_DN2423_c0_g2_i1.p1  ORF type:complete len:605 (+),score=170.12 TRINITY_DN2423_c0_g2_i1:101-1915(+)